MLKDFRRCRIFVWCIGDPVENWIYREIFILKGSRKGNKRGPFLLQDRFEQATKESNWERGFYPIKFVDLHEFKRRQYNKLLPSGHLKEISIKQFKEEFPTEILIDVM